MSTTDTRAAFEAWAIKENYAFYSESERSVLFYGVSGTRNAIQKAWEAGMAQAATEAAKATGTAGELPPLPEAWITDCTTTDPAARLHFAADQMREYGQTCAQAAWLAGGQHQHEVEKAARQPAPVMPEIVEIDAIGILREFVTDSHEQDVGGGDLVITTCEVREKAVALLKLLQDPELGECGCKPSDCPNNQKCKCVAATNRSQP